MWFGSIIIAIDARNSYMIAVQRARTRITGFTWLWSNFADKRRSWQHVQLDLLYTIDRPWLILHAELSSRCPERVSIFILDSRFSPLRVFPPFVPSSHSLAHVQPFTKARQFHEFNHSRARLLCAAIRLYTFSWICRVSEENSFRWRSSTLCRLGLSRSEQTTADYNPFCSSGSFRTKEHASSGERLIRRQRESVYSRLRSVPT